MRYKPAAGAVRGAWRALTRRRPPLARSRAPRRPDASVAARGWSACFIGAMQAVARSQGVKVPADVSVDTEIDLGTRHEQYFIQARLNVSLPGLDREVAQSLVDAAHQACPYSKATRNNIDVTLNLL
ncbi:Ohr family peroxiredoxin [Burkholderia gladioli]|nr:Ohr family peroxiredoxin [Burkholderia gladioli]